jgi:hypothetical protein
MNQKTKSDKTKEKHMMRDGLTAVFNKVFIWLSVSGLALSPSEAQILYYLPDLDID